MSEKLTEAHEFVSKDMFFRSIGRLNVHPSAERNRTLWRLPNHDIVAVSTPGYLCVGAESFSITPAGRHALEQNGGENV